MVQVYQEPLRLRYHAPVLSLASAFRVVNFLGAVVLALVVSYVTGKLSRWVILSRSNLLC